ncbi:DUF1190 domain-containing protein [Ensifer sp.]|jgi:uncharacterized protein YgiB involved in biofilm formation|uniref:DUF1190 domain-containing protein n=1 Tax=Ensifer sp. TaxID=1872086 RepID=UPI002E121A7D|nr:DUF1190 domain-containing protein [Ensifer sp.]
MRRRLSGRTPPVLALGTIAVSGLVLSSCGDKPPAEDVMFKSVDQCVQAGMDEQVCRAGYQDAMGTHLAHAPRFDRLAACEAEYGWTQCTQARAADGNGSYFIPFMAGYLLSTGIERIDDYYKYRRREDENGSSGGSGGGGGGGGGGGYVGSSPIYKTRLDQTVTLEPTRVNGSQSAHAASPQYAVKPINVSTRTVVRRGFGGRSMSFGFGG